MSELSVVALFFKCKVKTNMKNRYHKN